MSVIQKQSPLNLMGKVAIVTSAATPLGAQTCRTLLRHNCLVLGIDEVPIPESERLTSAQGTHFQRLQMTLDNDALQRTVDHSQDRFWKQGFDFLVTFDNNDSTVQFSKKIGCIMVDSGGGVLLNVLDKEEADTFYDFSGKDGLRTNVVLKNAFEKTGKGSLQIPEDTIEEVQEGFTRFRKSTDADVSTAKGHRALADLLLFLVSSLGKDIDRAAVTANGNWRTL